MEANGTTSSATPQFDVLPRFRYFLRFNSHLILVSSTISSQQAVHQNMQRQSAATCYMPAVFATSPSIQYEWDEPR